MCGCAEWENLLRRVEDAVEEGRVRDFLSDAAAGIDALIDEITGWGCASGDTPWVRGRGPGSRREWVA
jgi:hypothetical protein